MLGFKLSITVNSRWAVQCSVVLGRSFRNKSSKDMAFPHPKSRKDNYRKEDKPNSGGVVWNFFKRTINITECRSAKDNVNPAKNRTLGGTTDHLIPFHWESAACFFQSVTPGFWIVWVQKNKECMLFAVPASVHQKQFLRQGFHLIYFEILQE